MTSDTNSLFLLLPLTSVVWSASQAETALWFASHHPPCPFHPPRLVHPPPPSSPRRLLRPLPPRQLPHRTVAGGPVQRD